MGTEQLIRDLFDLMGQIVKEAEDWVVKQPEHDKGVCVRGYGSLYQEPIEKIASFIFQQVGLWDAFVAAAQSPDPNAALIDLARTAEPNNELFAEHAYLVCIAWFVLLVNLDAVASFHCSMAGLMDRVEQGDDSALFCAVLLDASVLHAQPVADRVSRATLLDDRSFFDKLSKAITQTKPTRPKPHLDGVRLLLNILDAAGELERMTDSELTDWAVNKIGVYPSEGDPYSAVRDQRRKRDRVKEGPKV